MSPDFSVPDFIAPVYEAVTVNVIGGADAFWLVARMLAFVLDVRTKLEFDQSIV